MTNPSIRRLVLGAVGLSLPVGCGAAMPPAPPSGLETSSDDPLACLQLEAAAEDPLREVAGTLEVVPLMLDDVAGELDESDVDGWTGVSLAFAAPRGWTKPWLERRIACYRKTQAAAGPLAVDGSHVAVLVREGRFVLQVTSRDPAAVQRVWEATLHRVRDMRVQSGQRRVLSGSEAGFVTWNRSETSASK